MSLGVIYSNMIFLNRLRRHLWMSPFSFFRIGREVVRGRHELAVLEKLVVSKQTELQHSKRWLAEERVAWLNRFGTGKLVVYA